MDLRLELSGRNYSRAVLLIHAVGIVSFVLAWLFLPLSFELATLRNLIVGDATMYGVDVSLRVRTAYQLIVGGGIGVLLAYAILRQLTVRRWLVIQQYDELLLMSTAIICLSFLRAMDVKCQNSLNMLFSIWCWRMLMIALMHRWPSLGIPGRKDVFALSLAYAFLLFFAAFFLFGGKALMNEHPLAVLLTLVVILSAVYLIMQHMAGWSVQRTSSILAPLAAVPVLSFFVLELFFYVKQTQGDFIRFRLIWIVAMLSLFAINAWLLYRRKMLPLQRMIRIAVAPAVVIAFAILAMYTPVVDENTEMFENANQAIPLMHVFQYGRIPMLDFMSSHMLSEQWPGYLYTFIFGYNDTTEYKVYEFMNGIVFLLLVYWLLNRVFRRPLLSAFFVLLFPLATEVFFEPIFSAILPFFFSRNLIERPTPRLFFGLFLTLLGILLWRLDAGSAALFATVVYFPLLWWACKAKFPVAAFIKGLSLFAAFVLAGLVFAALLRSPTIVMKHIQMALHYVSANQAHGYRQLMWEFAHQFYILHVLLPAVAAVACIYILMQLRMHSPSAFGRTTQLLAASMMLFILCIANMQRGLVRHGYAENREIFFTSTFFAAIGLLCAYLLATQRPAARVSVLYGTTFWCFFMLKFFPFKTGTVMAETAMTQNAFRNADSVIFLTKYEGRTHKNEAFASLYKPLKYFLDVHLGTRQTFLDFSNSPMLYYYCKRESPGYFSQNLQNSVDDYLQTALLQQVDTHKAPVVVFAGYPRTWLDQLDGVPNTTRYYIVAEYIFSNYRPYGVLSDKSIWISRGLKAPQATTQDTLLDKADVENLNLLPEYTGAFYANDRNAKDLQTIRNWSLKDAGVRHDSLHLILDATILSEQHCYLGITFKKTDTTLKPNEIALNFLDTARHIVGSFHFTRRDKVSSVYMLRLSNHFFWHQYGALQLDIVPAPDIEHVFISKDLRF